MLAKHRRIRSARDHRDIWRSGRVLRGKFMVIRYRLHPGATSRFGFVVSSAIAKKAVVRNTIKRRFRSVTQEKKYSGFDAVLYATKTAPGATYQQIREEVQRLLPGNTAV